MTVSNLVCRQCKGARWVCESHGEPWHPPTETHCGCTGMPCPTCNPGPEHEGWNTSCLDCVDGEKFVSQNPDDADAILAALESEFGEIELPDVGRNVAEMNDVSLVRYFQGIRQELLAMGEMLGMVRNDASERALDLHLRYAAALTEIRKRGYKY